ncbi:acyl-coenzyme A diphosphatase NUDT19-like isoform X2 [Prorops nasuta]|uniref:acyl-coenzyme A diphosphatase NUDT19-like isoform X2 n=1 Tax=Prorops nasuta TaxID=863751 RepID=UPI0034CD18E5
MKTCRNSASLIIAAYNKQNNNDSSLATYNYSLLCLKRHQKSSFLPGSYVFPGGVAEPADADLKWNNIFSKFNLNYKNLLPLIPNTAQPSILKSAVGELPRQVSLRITAIRETFEECGILICKKHTTKKSRYNWAQHLEVIDPDIDLHDWKSKVHSDATQFYELCEKLQCYPDLWALHEWSNWMTPLYMSGKRFDTIFFLTCLSSIPETNFDEKEMEDMKWDLPNNFFKTESEIILPPPQYYEIKRIGNFQILEDLHRFAADCSMKNIQLFLPVRVNLLDGFVHVLPGDSMYPEEAKTQGEQVLDKTDMTIRELRDISYKKNRFEFFLDFTKKQLVIDNFDIISDVFVSPKVYIENLKTKL